MHISVAFGADRSEVVIVNLVIRSHHILLFLFIVPSCALAVQGFTLAAKDIARAAGSDTSNFEFLIQGRDERCKFIIHFLHGSITSDEKFS